MNRDVLTVGSTMRIPLSYRGEYSQWVERFMNYLEEQTDGEAMIHSIKNGDQPLPRVTQVSIVGTSSTEQPPLKDKSMWSDQEKRIQKIDRLARSLLIQGLRNDIYSLIDSNKTAKDLWDALARHMLGSEYGEQDRKAAKVGYAVSNGSGYTVSIYQPEQYPKREFRSSRKHFKTLSLDESRLPNVDRFSDQEDYSEEEVAEIMAKTIEQYMSKTQTDYGSGVVRPKIKDKDHFELKGQFLKEVLENTFNSSNHEDANEHIEKVLEITDLFHVPNINEDQLMLRVFFISLTGAACHWLRNEPTG
nr:hypothetical protein [Tanacetum cinerariifolium]